MTDDRATRAFVEWCRLRSARTIPAAVSTSSSAIADPRLAGDSWRLRGIPVVGVKGGVGGASPGTRPGSNLR